MSPTRRDVWPALLLTAGLGTRMRPLSYVRAKPAMPVAGPALVCRILRWLAEHGVQDTVLNLHYKPETITAAVGDGTSLGIRVRYSWEHPVLGSAGGPRQALPLIDAPRFFLINGDTLTDVELGALADHHVSRRATITMALVVQPDWRRYGGVSLDEDGAVTGFVRKGMPSTYHFVGVQAVDAEAFAHLPMGEPAETVTSLYPQLIDRHPGSVRAFVCDATFHDIGTPRDYLYTALALAREEAGRATLVGRDVTIEPTASVTDTVVWDNVVVSGGAVLDRCVLADGVTVPANGCFDHAAIVPRFAGYTPLAGEEIVGNLLVRRF